MKYQEQNLQICFKIVKDKWTLWGKANTVWKSQKSGECLISQGFDEWIFHHHTAGQEPMSIPKLMLLFSDLWTLTPVSVTFPEDKTGVGISF